MRYKIYNVIPIFRIQASDNWPWDKLPTLLKADLVTQLKIKQRVVLGTVVYCLLMTCHIILLFSVSSHRYQLILAALTDEKNKKV